MRLPLAGGGVAQAGPGGGIMPVDELAIPGRHNVSNALAAIAVGLLFGIAPDAIRRAAAAFTGVEHRLQPVGLLDGVRFVNDSQGTQPDAVIAALRAFPAPVVLIAGGRDKGVDLSGLARVVADTAYAAVLIGESGPTLERLFREAGLARTDRAATLDEAVSGRGRVRAPRPRRCTARHRRHRDPEPGGGVVRHVRGLRGPGPRVHRRRRPGSLPRAAPRPPPGREDPHEHDAAHGRPGSHQGPRTRSTLQRERHEPEYGILVATVALAAIGILMVYSSSAIKSYLATDDPFAIVGPQIQWAGLGIVAMLVMMRVDYRWLRVASVPLFIVGIVGAAAGVHSRRSTSRSVDPRAGSRSGRCPRCTRPSS